MSKVLYSTPIAGKVKAIMVDVDSLGELTDLASIASFLTSPAVCPGGRYIVPGYRCIHCGVDTSVEKGVCKAPRSATLPTSYDDVVRSMPIIFESDD